jgi:hypothetical protein
MILLFLDVDGVLNSRDYISRDDVNFDDPDQQMDPDAIARLNQITDATGASIVVSSTWRLGWLDDSNGLDKLQYSFKLYGITGKIIGMTPHKPNCIRNQRGKEIQAWLDFNRINMTNDVEKFVILDDDADMGKLKDHLVLTKFKNGLQDKHVEEIIKRLK